MGDDIINAGISMVPMKTSGSTSSGPGGAIGVGRVAPGASVGGPVHTVVVVVAIVEVVVVVSIDGVGVVVEGAGADSSDPQAVVNAATIVTATRDEAAGRRVTEPDSRRSCSSPPDTRLNDGGAAGFLRFERFACAPVGGSRANATIATIVGRCEAWFA